MTPHIPIWAWLIVKLIVNLVAPPNQPYPNSAGAALPVTSAITPLVQRKLYLGLCLQVPHRRPFTFSKSPNQGYSPATTANLIALLLSGDVELNPGPRPSQKSIFPCGFCQTHVDFGQKATCCDTCDVWFHKTCVSMDSTTFSLLNSQDDWFCYRCNSVNHNSQSFHSFQYSLPTSNSFSALADTDDNVFPSPNTLRPSAHSSPVGTIPSHTAAHISSVSSSATSESYYNPPKGSNWRTLTININGLFGKAPSLHHMLEYIRPDAVFISETKLHQHITNAEVIPDDLGYTVYRKDRENGSPYGGVMLLIRSCFASVDITPPDIHCESIWVEVTMKNQRKLLLNSYYRPPSDTVDKFTLFRDSISRVTQKYCRASTCIIIGGDLNCPDINWENSCVKTNSPRRPLHDMLLNTLADFSLSQLITEPTREHNILDLTITNSPGSVKSTHVTPGLSDHEAAVCDFNLAPLFNRKAPRKVHIYSRANWTNIKADIVDFSTHYFEVLRNENVESKWHSFKHLLTSAITKHVPSVTISSRYHLPWMTRPLLRLVRKKHRLFKKARKSNKTGLWERLQVMQEAGNPGSKASQRHLRQQCCNQCVRR